MNKKKIGIIGGMGPEALSDMYLEICKYYQVNFGAKYDKDFPPMIMYSVPIPDVVESIESEEKTLEMLMEAVKTLEEDGCDFIVIACNSVQFLLKDIQKGSRVPVIGIAETVAKYLNDKGFKKAGILATKTTIEKNVYDSELKEVGVELICPDEENQNAVTDVIMTQLAGKASPEEEESLISVIEGLKANGAEVILIACTDLPLVIKNDGASLPLINCTEIYANEAAKLSS